MRRRTTSALPTPAAVTHRAAQAYVLALEEMVGARISAVGVGPEREAIVVRHDLLG